MFGDRFATRLNAFKPDGPDKTESADTSPLLRMAARAATAKGLTDIDLNYPDHVESGPSDLFDRIRDLGLSINGLAMRYGGVRSFMQGAFTNPDQKARRDAIDLTKRGIDAARSAGSSLMTIWLGQDGFDYSFQADYGRMWVDLVEGIRAVALHDPDCTVSIEYKPNEPRAFSILPNLAATLHALSDADCPNLGVTLDFAHMLYAGENPAASARMAAEKSTIAGVHLNDGYSKRDDGLMVGSVHRLATLEFLCELVRCSYDGVAYFDTFPDASGMDPVRECEANIRSTRRLAAIAKRLARCEDLAAAIAKHDAISAHEIVESAESGLPAEVDWP